MGGTCCTSRESKSEANARQLDSLFILTNKDFARKGNLQDMLKNYDIMQVDG